jgi:hypothetical protein
MQRSLRSTPWLQSCKKWNKQLDRFQLFFQQLLAVQLGVVAVALDQLLMRPIFNDFAVMKHGDTVGIPNS